MVDSDQLENDPFFRVPADSDWNACIGKQGTEENYLEGYIEAAIELVTTIIEKKMLDKRDTVVLPILYNARHAIELVLKFTINRLAAIGVVSSPKRPDHNIRNYLELLERADLGDEALSEHIRDLKPFVESLSRIDTDGQGLRYHIRRDGNHQGLSDYSLANLEVIRDSLTKLSKVISALRYRIEGFIDERSTQTYTKRLSRRDLMSIAEVLPTIDGWERLSFEVKKRRVQSRYNLSNDEFCEAINVITNNREMKALVGGETSLLYIPDHILLSVVEQWRKLHPRRTEGEPSAVEKWDLPTIDEMTEHYRIQAEVVVALHTCLTDQQLAELEAICSLGRYGGFPESHEHRVEQSRKRPEIEADARKQITDLINKTNFLDALVKALRRLGRPSLADRLSKI
jgi:hypothetical protein